MSLSASFFTTNAQPICESAEAAGDLIQCNQVGEVPVSVSSGLFWTTGGGFSNLTTNPTPDWQAREVRNYMNQETTGTRQPLPPQQYWNAQGRGYPDLSMIGHNIMLVTGGKIGPAGNTFFFPGFIFLVVVVLLLFCVLYAHFVLFFRLFAVSLILSLNETKPIHFLHQQPNQTTKRMYECRWYVRCWPYHGRYCFPIERRAVERWQEARGFYESISLFGRSHQSRSVL